MKQFITILLLATAVRAEVKPIMQEFYKITNQLQPYILDKNSFMQSSNEKEIAQALAEFSRNTKLLKKDKMAQNDDMKFRAKLLAGGLDEAEESFKTGFKEYSYWVLKASYNNCFSCHTQKGLASSQYTFDNLNSSDSYSKAEFLFIVRNYIVAIPQFADLLSHYPENKATVENIEAAAQKMLFYAIRVSREDSTTIALFDRVLKNPGLPSSLRNDILAWKNYLNIRKYRIDEDQVITNEKMLERFMKTRKNLYVNVQYSNQRAAVDLDTTHFLFKLLEKSSDNSLKPAILYWLSTIEKDYRLGMYDQTADNYLKECIEKYSSAKIAKKCFTLYKEIIVNSYTGSRGTVLPNSVAKQLETYQKIVNQK